MSAALRVLVLWVAALQVAVAEETAAAQLVAALAGNWQGAGEVRGMPSKQEMRWESVLDGRFLRLSFDNRMTAPDGKEWRFQADAYYRIQADGTIAGTWFDSRGFTFPLAGSADDAGVLTIDWGSDDTERGLSRYQIKDGRLEVTDEVKDKDGTIRVFGRSTLERKP
jgi:hypothetical protein